jgi:uncharacterized protein YkwD
VKTLLLAALFASSAAAQSFDFRENLFASIPGDSLVEDWVVRLVNEERARAGLRPMVQDVSLRSAARQHSSEMMALRYFSHTSPHSALAQPIDRIYRSGLSDCEVGENIAVHGLDGTPREMAGKFMDLWMNSPGHRANILSDSFNRIGVGIVTRRDTVLQDTVVAGVRRRVWIYTIEHYGTQNFSRRSLEFDFLTLVRKDTLWLMLDLEIGLDRPVLLQTEHYSCLLKPDGPTIRTSVRIPYAASMKLSLAYLESAMTQEYVKMFEDRISGLSMTALNDKTARSRFPLRFTRVGMQPGPAWFLVGRADYCDDEEPSDISIYVNKDETYRFAGVSRSMFDVPISEQADTVMVDWAFGAGRKQPVRHSVRLISRAIRQQGAAAEIFGKTY